MNAERLHIVASALRRELSEKKTVAKLRALVNALKSIVGQNNASTQQELVNSRDDFYAAVTDTETDSFAPAWQQIVADIGGQDLFGRTIKQKVVEVIAANQMTPGVAHQELARTLERLEEFEASLDNLKTAFDHFNVGSEELKPGEAEITILIPREAVDSNLSEFAVELKELKFILNTFSRVATGETSDLKIRSLSSSGLMIYLAAVPVVAGIVAKVVDYIVGQYKKILEIKKLQLEIARLELPAEISEKTKEHANSMMGTAIEEFTVKLLQEYPQHTDGGTQNELRNTVTVSLSRIANRIDQGFNFEVRIQPPKEASKDPQVDQAVKTIQAASANMQYLKLEGPTILELPENVEASEASKAKPELESKPRKRASSKRDEETKHSA